MGDHFSDTVICPKCEDENAFFNGVTYECPDCGYEWEHEMHEDIEEEYPDK